MNRSSSGAFEDAVLTSGATQHRRDEVDISTSRRLDLASIAREDHAMLPAWATVAIAIGGAALGAVSGLIGSHLTLRVARLNSMHEDRVAWRNRMLEAAEEFSAAVMAVNWALGRVQKAKADEAL